MPGGKKPSKLINLMRNRRRSRLQRSDPKRSFARGHIFEVKSSKRTWRLPKSCFTDILNRNSDEKSPRRTDTVSIMGTRRPARRQGLRARRLDSQDLTTWRSYPEMPPKVALEKPERADPTCEKASSCKDTI